MVWTGRAVVAPHFSSMSRSRLPSILLVMLLQPPSTAGAPNCTCPTLFPYCFAPDSFCYASSSSDKFDAKTCAGTCTGSRFHPPCSCSSQYPYCFGDDRFCYASATSDKFDAVTCAGTCSQSFDAVTGSLTVPVDFRAVDVGYETSVRVTFPTGGLDKDLPLILLLHGYGDTADNFISHFGLQSQVGEGEGFIMVTPNGRKDDNSKRYWAAWGDWCGTCNGYEQGSAPLYDCYGSCGDTDVDYLREVVRAVSSEFKVDARRVYVLGHSNGAGMTFRLACVAADLFAAVVPIEGAPPTGSPAYTCAPAEPIGVLVIQGTADDTVYYNGDTGYVGCVDAVELFAGLRGNGTQGCAYSFPANARKTGRVGDHPATLDLSERTSGKDTEVYTAEVCAARDTGATVELWKVRTSHYTTLNVHHAAACLHHAAACLHHTNLLHHTAHHTTSNRWWVRRTTRHGA